VNLVLQGPSLTENQARRFGPAERIADRAWRIRGAVSVDAGYCEKNRIDHALVPEGRRFADLKLLAMDMDSTLITMETIDELGELVG
jgi:phosphoserine phosphatase